MSTARPASARPAAPRRSLLSRATATAAALGLLASGAVVAVGATSLELAAAPAAQAATSSTVDGAASAATLSWGLKESFRSYLTKPFVGGVITTSGGATQGANNGVFSFGSGAGTLRGGTGTLSFKGTVRIQGHHGQMDLTLSNPQVVLTSGTAGELRLDAKLPQTTQTEAFEKKNAVVAKLSFSGASVASGKLELNNAAAVLTADGAKAFGGMYSTGDAVDPVSVRAAFAARTATAIKASAGSSQYGTNAWLTASGLPSGAKVAFKRGSTTLGTATANSRGTAVLKAKAGGVGTQRLSASFGGSASKKPAAVAFTAKVNKRSSATQVAAPKFKKNTKAKATVTVPRLADGSYAAGKVSVTWDVPGKKATTKSYTLSARSKGKLTVSAPHASKKTVGLQATFQGSSTTHGSKSKKTWVKVR
ncbi:HtaA domain-containing protein [Galactobacter caseinivorans]|uniref:Htaa domain-containing protein n=1 Tax=Galactobacter caseinivorans TaxID=2676123 RepID=A0A496PGA0_9MICC|nr:HtaA domain-containing protein [Galactobacter caseinivorans]RKW69468.1 hypothetical protein DWQ67_13020 [Galactobacter caseinivorans]